MSLEMKYFVLKPRGDDDYAAASRHAMFAYASVIQSADPELAYELRQWVHREDQLGRQAKEE